MNWPVKTMSSHSQLSLQSVLLFQIQIMCFHDDMAKTKKHDNIPTRFLGHMCQENCVNVLHESLQTVGKRASDFPNRFIVECRTDPRTQNATMPLTTIFQDAFTVFGHK